MTTPDYLWPARPEYLRRGTPVEPVDPMWWACDPSCIIMPGEAEGTIMLRPLSDGTVLVAWYNADMIEYKRVSHLSIDLRDVTARAHAAMAYWIAGRYHADRHARVLCRMRALDESVTVAEAREALAWAESVAHDE